MPISSFIQNLPPLDLPFPETSVTTRAIRSDRGLMVFFFIHEDAGLPEHSHKGQ